MQKSSVNKVILVGHIGNKPEGRYTPAGTSTASFSLATNESWIDSEKEKQERTEWHRVVFFNRLAEIVGEYLRKGSKVYIEGSLRTREWEKDGVKRYTTEIVANEMQMLDSKGTQEGMVAPVGQTVKPQQSQQSQQSQQPVQQQAAPVGMDDFDDDIPF